MEEKDEVKVEKKEDKESKDDRIKKEIDNNSSNNKKNKMCSNFFTSRIFLMTCTFILGAFIMWGLAVTINGGVFHKKVYSENVKTTTLEETSDLKNAINNVYRSN